MATARAHPTLPFLPRHYYTTLGPRSPCIVEVFELYCDKSGPYSPISSFLRMRNKSIQFPTAAFSVLVGFAQPQRDMRRLHRLLDDR